MGAALVALYSWPWIDAKAYAIASPAPVLLAGVGVSNTPRGGPPGG